MDEGLFVGKPDRFKGVTVRSEEEPCSSEEFKQKLEKSLAEWKARVSELSTKTTTVKSDFQKPLPCFLGGSWSVVLRQHCSV